MCGEKPHPHGMIFFSLGSPPHVRGKADRLRGLQAGTGITPACAGKSAAAQVLGNLYRDHPRMCGEKTKKIP